MHFGFIQPQQIAAWPSFAQLDIVLNPINVERDLKVNKRDILQDSQQQDQKLEYETFAVRNISPCK